MKSNLLLIVFSVLLTLSFVACSDSVSDKKLEFQQQGATFQVIQFHSEHRCFTCNKIEEFTRATLQEFPEITFELVNVDDRDNESMAEFFEATGTALFLYNSETREKMNLTDFAFMQAGNEDKFKAELKKEMNRFFNDFKMN